MAFYHDIYSTHINLIKQTYLNGKKQLDVRTYIDRVRAILKTNLNARNGIDLITNLMIQIETYGVTIIN